MWQKAPNLGSSFILSFQLLDISFDYFQMKKHAIKYYLSIKKKIVRDFNQAIIYFNQE